MVKYHTREYERQFKEGKVKLARFMIMRSGIKRGFNLSWP